MHNVFGRCGIWLLWKCVLYGVCDLYKVFVNVCGMCVGYYGIHILYVLWGIYVVCVM